MVVRTPLRSAIVVCLVLAGCGSRDAHRFTDVVATKPSPDGKLVAALVWNEHGPGKPHLSAVVIAAKGGELLDGDPVVIASEDYRPLDFRWKESDTLEVRLPCGTWSSLTNRWRMPGTRRAASIDFLPPQRCMAVGAGTALPVGASQPAAIDFSPN